MPRPKSKKGTKANREKYVREDKLTEKIALDPEQIRYVAIQLGVTPQEVPHMENSPFAAFHKKDVGMINNHPMAWYLREQQAFLKRKKHKAHRQEQFAAKPPEAPWDQTLRARFPSFADAVHELDDALTTIALFAQMSGDSIIPSERILHCRRVLTEFHYYVSRNRLVSKAFISVRGFYFQANIEGQDVTWLVPHPFPVPKDEDVDYKVLLAFLDLYEHLLEFVNAHLFIRLGLKYPPEYDSDKWDDGYYIDAIIDHSPKDEDESNSLPALPTTSEEPSAATALLQELLSSGNYASTEQANQENDIPSVTDQGLFSNFKFTISHELHPDIISFVIHCLGGAVEWNDDENPDPTITHTITDRSFSEGNQTRFLNRTYVQPQWIFDCLNKKTVLDATLYTVGVPLPPHLSPFEKEYIQDEEPGNDEREVEIGANESDEEINEETRRLAEEQAYIKGIKEELNEEGEEQEETISPQEIKAKKLAEKKEEAERLAAGQLSHRKTQLYKKLKEKESMKKIPLKRRLQEEEEENEKIKEGELENNDNEEEDYEEDQEEEQDNE